MVPLLIGTADLARLQAERHRGAARHGTDVRDLPVRQHEVTGLDGCASFFRRLLQVMFGLGAIGQFLGFLSKQGGDAFVPEFVFHSAANLLERRSGRRLDRHYLEHGVALRCLHLVGRGLFGLAKHRAHELRRTANARQSVGAAHKVSVDDVKALGCRGFVQARAARLRQQGIHLIGGSLGSFLLLDGPLNLIFDFIQRLHVRGLLVVERMMWKP